jgi:hypothetical protein
MFALAFIEGIVNHLTIFDVNLRRVRVRLPCESVLHPVLIITLEKLFNERIL